MRYLENAENALAMPSDVGGLGAGPEEHVSVLSPAQILWTLWRRAWLIVLCLFVGVGCAWLYLKVAKPRYQSSAKIYIDRKGPTVIREAEANMLMNADNFRSTQAELMHAMPVLDKVANDPSVVPFLPHGPDPVGYLRQGLETHVDEFNLVHVTFTAESPVAAAAIANSVVGAYQKFSADQRHSTNSEVMKLLQIQKDKADEEYASQLKKLTDFRAANSDLLTGSGDDNHAGADILAQLTRYNDALGKAKLDLVDSQSLYDRAKDLQSDPVAFQQFITSQATGTADAAQLAKIRTLHDQIDEAQLAQSQLATRFGENHPGMLIYREKLLGLRRDLASAESEFQNSGILTLKQRVELGQGRVEKLDQLVKEEQDKAGRISTEVAQLDLLRTQLGRSKEVVDNIDKRMRELNASDDTATLNVAVIEPAVPLADPSSPNRSKYFRFFAAGGVMMGIAAALLLEVLGDRLRSANSASTATGLSVLTMLPKSNGNGTMGSMVQREPQSSFAENFRSLRTAVFFGTEAGHRRSILVTSALPGEGKSTVACNLAQTFSQAGRKTIIIDCDFRRPSIHTSFGLSNEFGVTSVLAGKKTLDEAVFPHVFNHLDVLTCGPLPHNPAELLSSGPMRDLMVQLVERYDHVIVDSTPVLGITDARILAAMVDTTLLVVRADMTRRRAAQQARQQLDSIGANVLGLVINGTARQADPYASAY